MENILKEEYDKNIKIVRIPENLYLYNKNLFDNTNPVTSIYIYKNYKQKNIMSQKYSDLNINTVEQEKEDDEEKEKIIKLAEDILSNKKEYYQQIL